MGDNNCDPESPLTFDWVSVDDGIRSEGPDLHHVAPTIPPCGQKAIFKVRKYARKALRDKDIPPLQQSYQGLTSEDAAKLVTK